ncbi:MAG: hypothetical protein HGA47_06335 [Zoogloea sp.]|nr:hypothetical protein [Zoogloea sp.]
MLDTRLVVLGSSLTALAIARHARQLGRAVVLVDGRHGPAMESRSVTARLMADAGDDRSLQALCALGEEGGRPTCPLIATGDDWLRFMLRHRVTLETCFELLHADDPVLETCLDKTAFAEWCVLNAIAAPRYWPGSTARDAKAGDFPLLLRPSGTLHGIADAPLPKAQEVADAGQLRHWLAAYDAAGVRPVVTESLLGRRLTQFSVPFVRRRDGTASLFVARKLRPSARYCRAGSYVELFPDPGAESLVRHAIERLGYYGMGEAEVLHSADDGRYFLVEINARPWLQYALAPASGHDFLGWLLDAGKPPAVRTRTTGLRWIDFHSDLHVCFSRSEGMFRRGELSLSGYLASLTRSNVHARFDWRDGKPFRRGSAALARDLFAGLVRMAGVRP